MNLHFLVVFALLAQPLTSSHAAPKPAGKGFGVTLKTLESLSQKDLKQLFDVKSSKNESLRDRLKTFDAGNQPGMWATGDTNDAVSVEGTSTEKSYSFFNIPTETATPVIVAVIDSGVDINHEDLQGKIWHNPACTLNPNTGKYEELTDDGDGYKNDCYGWNFIGGYDQDGNIVNIGATTLEVTREYARLKKKQEIGALSTEEAAYFKIVADDYHKQASEKQKTYDRYMQFDAAFKLLKANGLKEETIEAVNAIVSDDINIQNAKSLVIFILQHHVGSDYVASVLEDLNDAIKFQFNTEFDSSTIVGDHPEILDEKGYGNNDVTGPDASHGTHVSGIIAANRLNNFGILGQASNVQIMAIRAVPNGDERDKDVANAIRYAVDHKARVINMSFGKPYSPQKSYVDSAMKYAADHGVILVHAAGNDGKNTETGYNNFPNKKILASKSGEEVSTWIEVGASSKSRSATLPATFSNYGKTSVDLFAPGVDIVSTVPGNKYASYQGTSMASPEVAGVTALVLSLFPNIQATQLRATLMATVTLYPGLNVNQPADDESDSKVVPFSSLSVTGGVVNSYRAIKSLLPSR